MVDPWQVAEARAIGADAILIIVAALNDSEMQEIEAAAIERGMDVLVETHDAAELDRALRLQSRLIGVNNRNLKDFTVDFARTYELIDRAPKDCTFVAESGLSSNAPTLPPWRAMAYDAFLCWRKPDARSRCGAGHARTAGERMTRLTHLDETGAARMVDVWASLSRRGKQSQPGSSR